VISVSSARKGSLVAATAVLDPQIEAAEYLVDVSGKAVNQPKMSGGVDFLLSSAVTPDGRTALGAGFYGHVVSVFNVEQRTRDPKSIRVDGTPISIAINREGTLALVAGDDRHLHVIDLATRTLEPGGIDIGPSDPECLFFFMLPASQMAITPDGAFAFVLRRSGTEVAIVDIEARALIGTISVPDSGTVPPYFAIGIAIGDDGTIILCNGLAITLL
jgi:DNA-binding beta-propeller fold protein YncE